MPTLALRAFGLDTTMDLKNGVVRGKQVWWVAAVVLLALLILSLLWAVTSVRLACRWATSTA